MIRLPMMLLKVHHLASEKGWREEVISAIARYEGQFEIDSDSWKEICGKYEKQPSTAPTSVLPASQPSHGLKPVTAEPKFSEMTKNFTAAVGSWIKAGMPVVSEDIFQSRLSTCASCDHWSGDARMGFGKCKVCGCTRLKHWLATSKCPAGKW
jgi:hypothetical protein